MAQKGEYEGLSFSVGDEVVIDRRSGEHQTLKVSQLLYDAVLRTRSVLMLAASRGMILTYSEAMRFIDDIWPYRNVGTIMELIDDDCAARGEPSLAALCVEKHTGRSAVGAWNLDDGELVRMRCFEYWRVR